ncbi:hypothetical protein [Flavobacterium sp.]|uniref:hypothetical protein n=1 Tax=Flavobacterium sp. TaxID=239 RepID=UPI003D0FE404
MKKKLEAELISIAHRVLQLKHKDDIRELHREAQKLYEKLSILLFVEENLGEVKPTIGLKEIEDKLEHAFDYDDKVVVAQLAEEELDEIIETKSVESLKKIDPKIEEIQSLEAAEEDKPLAELFMAPSPKMVESTPEVIAPIIEEKTETTETVSETPTVETPTAEIKQISIDDLLTQVAQEPVFEKRDTLVQEEKIPVEIHKILEEKVEETKAEIPVVAETVKETVKTENFASFIPDFKEITFERVVEKPIANLNDKMTKTAGLSLNDRMAFEKNLFDGSTEDLNRVLSQLETFNNYTEAKEFIDEMVKPDYNEWAGMQEFEERFMEYVQSKFA